MMTMTTQEFVDSLTSEQVAKLHDIAFGKIPDEILALSDDELLAELFD
jgi:hypothetical protein